MNASRRRFLAGMLAASGLMLTPALSGFGRFGGLRWGGPGANPIDDIRNPVRGLLIGPARVDLDMIDRSPNVIVLTQDRYRLLCGIRDQLLADGSLSDGR